MMSLDIKSSNVVVTLRKHLPSLTFRNASTGQGTMTTPVDVLMNIEMVERCIVELRQYAQDIYTDDHPVMLAIQHIDGELETLHLMVKPENPHELRRGRELAAHVAPAPSSD